MLARCSASQVFPAGLLDLMDSSHARAFVADCQCGVCNSVCDETCDGTASAVSAVFSEVAGWSADSSVFSCGNSGCDNSGCGHSLDSWVGFNPVESGPLAGGLGFIGPA